MRIETQYRVVYYENGKKYMGLHRGVTSNEAFARAAAKEMREQHPEFENVHIEHRTATFSDWEE